MHRLVAPVYAISNATVKKFLWAATIVLWVHAARVTSSTDVCRALALTA